MERARIHWQGPSWLVTLALGCADPQASTGTPAPDSPGGMAGSSAVSSDELLSGTGLYLSDMRTLAPDIQRFTPAHALWADGAEKERFVYLPPDSTIDTSDPDAWRYPVGTKLWKSFDLDGKRIETRLLEKRPAGWFMMAYLWRESGADADAVPDGRVDALGTGHDVPNEDACGSCHLLEHDVVLGFSAVQLARAGDGVSLAELHEAGRLSSSVPSRELPGNATAQAALGYLHANCGSCHRPRSRVFDEQTRVDLWLTLGALDALEVTPTFTSTVGQATMLSDDPELMLVEPGEPEASALWLRMAARDRRGMPPLASEQVDGDGLDLIAAFIQALEVP
ncbi:MAG TPA: hypothetical protein VFU02_17225 [Polyangiaceae bacterium]|nr:hypothetical protein [Polyangiaceae bacterium]